MPRHILVDGYNVLFAIVKSAREPDRNYLLSLLAAYKSQKHVDVTVVFDRKTGNPAEGRQVLLQHGIRVVFSAPAQEADEILCRTVEESPNPKNLLVVSSDKAGVSKYCRKLGAEVIGSKDFFSFLTKRSGRSLAGGQEDREDEKPTILEKDVEYYLKKFTEKRAK